MKNILITGGAGFIGTNLALELLTQNHKVVVVDAFINARENHIQSLAKQFKNLTYVKADCCSYEEMEKPFQSQHFDIVFHLAAKKSIIDSISNPTEYMNNNMDSLEIILNLCNKYNVGKFVFPSSCSIYGNCKTQPITEDTTPNPLNPYSQSRLLGEQMIQAWNAKTKIPAIIFRVGNPVGANTEYLLGDNGKQNNIQLFPYIVKNAINDNEIILRGNNLNTPDGTAIRDYIHITDLTRIMCFVALDSTDNLEILNLGSGGKGYSVLDIINSAKQLLNKPIKYSFASSNQSEIEEIVLDCSKLYKKYNIRATKTLDDMMLSQIEFEHYLNDYKKNQPSF